MLGADTARCSDADCLPTPMYQMHSISRHSRRQQCRLQLSESYRLGLNSTFQAGQIQPTKHLWPPLSFREIAVLLPLPGLGGASVHPKSTAMICIALQHCLRAMKNSISLAYCSVRIITRVSADQGSLSTRTCHARAWPPLHSAQARDGLCSCQR